MGKYALICGGYINETIITDTCFSVVEDLPEPRIKLLFPRAFAASVALHNNSVLWVTGGIVLNGRAHQSTELLNISLGQSTPGPLLPMPLHSHCTVQINEFQVLLIGGMNEEMKAQNSTFLYDFHLNEWTQGPDLITARYGHVCGLVYDRKNEPILVVAGGLNPLAKVSTSLELLKLKSAKEWIEGPGLPGHLIGASMQTIGDQGVIVHGHNFLFVKCQTLRRCRIERLALSEEYPLHRQLMDKKYAVTMAMPGKTNSRNCAF